MRKLGGKRDMQTEEGWSWMWSGTCQHRGARRLRAEEDSVVVTMHWHRVVCGTRQRGLFEFD